MRLALHQGARRLVAHNDSKLVVNKFNGEFEARKENMIGYLAKARSEVAKFGHSLCYKYRGTLIPCRCASKFSIGFANGRTMICQTGKCAQLSEESPSVHYADSVAPFWVDHPTSYIKNGTFLEIKNKARKLNIKVVWFALQIQASQEIISGLLLKCARPKEVKHMLYELHESHYGNHLGRWSLAHKALTHGYYWPKMQKDATEYVLKYNQCQRYAYLRHRPFKNLIFVLAHCPFMQ